MMLRWTTILVAVVATAATAAVLLLWAITAGERVTCHVTSATVGVCGG